MMRRRVHGNPSAHAVSRDDDTPGIDSELPCIGRVLDECEDRISVFEVPRKTKAAGAAPGTAIVDCDRIPARSANRLRDVEIFLIAGKSVKEHERRMSSRA